MKLVSLTDPRTGSTAVIAADLGFNCFQFRANVGDTGVEAIDSAVGFADGQQPPSHSGIPLLFPFPNRIRNGRFSWEGIDYEFPEDLVPRDGSGNAIHGFCIDRPWRVVEQTESSATGVFRLSTDAPDRAMYWPGDGELTVKYAIDGATLRADISVQCVGERPFPWGFGTHAYFRLPLSEHSDASQCTVSAPVQMCWELENCLPNGDLRDMPEDGRLNEAPYYDTLKLDDVYTQVQSTDGVVECRIFDEKAGLQLVQRCPDHFREIVAFTPPWTTAVCLEPYTCTTDAINLQQQGIDAGWRVLEPGQTWHSWIEISVGPIVC